MQGEQSGGRRDLLMVGGLWLLLTVIVEALLLRFDLQPLAAAEEATEIDNTFRILMVMAAPVFTGVLAALIYSVVRFRAGDDDGDGPPIFTNSLFARGWFAVSSLLTIAVIGVGLAGIAAIDPDEPPDLVIEVSAEQWKWNYTYVEYGLTIENADELVLPVDLLIEFRVTSTDVVHSFWIPGFRQKIDAVPGRVTVMSSTPDVTGEFREDINFRVQCAELCGAGHARMRTRVRVLDEAAFADWVNETRAASNTAPADSSTKAVTR